MDVEEAGFLLHVASRESGKLGRVLSLVFAAG